MPRQYLILSLHKIQSPSPPSSFHHILLLSVFIAENNMNIIWYGISLLPVWVNSSDYVLTYFLAHLNLFAWEGKWEEKKPWFCTSSVQQQLKGLCAINIILIVTPRHCIKWAAVRKFNFTPARVSTLIQWRSNYLNYKNIIKIIIWNYHIYSQRKVDIANKGILT